ncbi:MAG: pilus assembly protein PilZ [Thermodesulfobacteriota bacterium]|nr:pilus assembly protein PilZ [Thermodesulfobacteriota bacterium]
MKRDNQNEIDDMEPAGKKHIIYKPISSKNEKRVKVFPNPTTTSQLKVKDESKLINLNEKTVGSTGKKSGKMKYLVDRINYINFKDETILINFQHKAHQHKVTKHVLPHPCKGDQLICDWLDIADLIPAIKNYRLQEILVPDDNKVLMFKPKIISANKKRITLKIPNQFVEINKRRVKRYDCHGVDVQMIQNSIIYCGELLDFSTMAFHIRLVQKSSATFKWINSNAKVNLILTRDKDIVYSGECYIFKQSGTTQYRDIVLEPMNFEIQRFKPKEYRTTRQELVPSPDAVFTHPFTQKSVQLKIINISGSGFSVEENKEDAVLLPGLVAPNATLKFAKNFVLQCRGQVVYSKIDEDQDDTVKCGITILDMDSNDHMDLLAMLGQAEDSHSYLCDRVDMEALWDFFFKNGMIYSRNYEMLHKYKDEIKKTYESLYTCNPHIARHFIYQDKGAIRGHMAMLRFYEKAWLLFMHDARSDGAQALQRLALLNQIARYVYESYSFVSANLDFLINYYDSNDSFSTSVFSSITRNTRSLKGCSIDQVGYFLYFRDSGNGTAMPEDNVLTSTHQEDLAVLDSFYENKSGGLLIQALDLRPESIEGMNRLSNEYSLLGFKRKRYLLTLRGKGQVKAIFMINISDIGLNMSDFTSCIQAFVVDWKNLSRDALFASFYRICRNLKKDSMPVFVYPPNCGGDLTLSFEQIFNLWILNTQFTDQFYKQVKLLTQKHADYQKADRYQKNE